MILNLNLVRCSGLNFVYFFFYKRISVLRIFLCARDFKNVPVGIKASDPDCYATGRGSDSYPELVFV